MVLGVEIPLIQAPMAGVQGSALAVAVSNAGGLGSLPCALLTVEAMKSELAAIRGQTARPGPAGTSERPPASWPPPLPSRAAPPPPQPAVIARP